MRRSSRNRELQALPPHGCSLPRQTRDQVKAPVVDLSGYKPNSFVDLFHCVGPTATDKQLVLEGLNPQRNPVHAGREKLTEPGPVERARVHLDGYLRAGCHAEGAAERVQDCRYEVRRHEGRRAAAEKDSLKGEVGCGRGGGDFAEEERDIIRDALVGVGVAG